LELQNFLLKFLDLIFRHEVPKLKLDLLDKTTAQQPKVQQFESTRFQDPQTAAAETSGSYYYSSDGVAVGSSGVGGKGRKVRGGGKRKNFPAKNHILSFLAGKFFLPRA
jgi:predicted oxidoreductase